MARKRMLTTEEIAALVDAGEGDRLHPFSAKLPLRLILKIREMKDETGISEQRIVAQALSELFEK